MDALYLYAIVRGAAVPTGFSTPTGSSTAHAGDDGGDVELRRIFFQDIGAVVGAVQPGQSTVTPENVLRHERIVEQLMRDYTLLPVRFGTILADERAVVTMLQARYAAFDRNLARVANRVELGVKILWSGAETLSAWRQLTGRAHDQAATPSLTGSSTPGVGYMLQRLGEQAIHNQMRQRAAALTDTIHQALLPLAVEGKCTALVSPDLAMSAQYLVEKTRVERFRQTVAQLAKDRDLRFLCSGPWPPYNFIEPEREM